MLGDNDTAVEGRTVSSHLQSALQTADRAEKNYHVRQAMQLLIATQDAPSVEAGD